MRIRKDGPADPAMNDEDLMSAVKVSDALAHPARIRMFRYILSENIARRIVRGKDVVNAFDYSQATISQHLSKLIMSGLLETRRDGTSTCYYARAGALIAYANFLVKIKD
jgi:ArsR family transcriptional regulator